MKNIIKYFMLIFLFSGIFLFSCKQSNEIQNGIMGTVKFKITDAPFPIDLIEKAEITVSKLELKEAKGGDKYISVFNEEIKIDLLKLTNGVTELLAEVEVPEGNYSEARFYVKEAIIKFINQQEFTLKTPSALQSGIKIFILPSIMVNSDVTTEVLLDFDLSQSIVINGPMNDINNYIFKPVIRAVNNSLVGSLSGKVTDSLKKGVKNVQVSVLIGDNVLTSSFSDKDAIIK